MDNSEDVSEILVDDSEDEHLTSAQVLEKLEEVL